MTNMILYKFAKNKEYTLKNLVNDYEKNLQDDMQGIIFSEYDDEYMKATYWLRKKKKEYKYNIDKRQFEEAEEEVINIAEFEIHMDKTKLIVFGNKQLAQRIITLIGIISKNAYTVSEYVIDINMLVNRICKDNVILKPETEDNIIDVLMDEMNKQKSIKTNDYQLEQPVKTSDGAYIQLCYTRKLPGRNKLLEYEKRYLRMNIRKISDREVVIDIRQQSSIDSKNALKFIETISKGDSTLNLRHINLELLNGKNKIEFFDRIAAYTFGMWRLKTITGITVKQGTIEEDEEDEEVRIDDENEASTLSGISQAVLNGSGLRSNEFVQESINKGYYISAMRYRYEHKQDATEFAVVLSFKNQDLRVDIDKTYLEEEGRIYVQPFVKAEQNEIVVKFQDAAYKIFGELLEMQNAE